MKKHEAVESRESRVESQNTPAVALAALPSLENQTVQQVLTVNIVPSPFQPRKDFPAEEMEDLANSVRANGIQIPLLGRPSPVGLAEVELIAGERRFRTAKTLKLESVPMIVRPLTDEEVIRIQRLENAGRENLKALEAAEDYLLLQSQGKTVEEICTLHGVKRSHVFTRIRVAKLPAEIKQLIKDGKLSITVADLIAKLPTEEMQNELTIRACKPDYYGDLPSFRAMQEIIAEEYTRNLSGAAWLKGKGGDVDLIEGVNPCATCPKRSGNMEDAEGSANVCTDVKCFAAKQAAHNERALNAAKTEGRTIIAPEAYSKNRYAHEETDRDCYEDKKERTWGELAKAAKIQPAVTVYDNQLLEVFTPEQQNAIRAAHKLKTERSNTGQSAADKAKQEAERKAIEDAITAAVLSSARDLDDTKPVPLNFWRQLARTVLLHFEYNLKETFKGRGLKYTSNHPADQKTMQEYITKQASCHNLVGLMVELLLRSKVTRYSPDPLTIWDVDWKQFLPGAQSPAKKAKVKPAKTSKPAKAKPAKATKTAKSGKKGGAK